MTTAPLLQVWKCGERLGRNLRLCEESYWPVCEVSMLSWPQEWSKDILGILGLLYRVFGDIQSTPPPVGWYLAPSSDHKLLRSTPPCVQPACYKGKSTRFTDWIFSLHNVWLNGTCQYRRLATQPEWSGLLKKIANAPGGSGWQRRIIVLGCENGHLCREGGVQIHTYPPFHIEAERQRMYSKEHRKARTICYTMFTRSTSAMPCGAACLTAFFLPYRIFLWHGCLFVVNPRQKLNFFIRIEILSLIRHNKHTEVQQYTGELKYVHTVWSTDLTI